MHQDGHIWLVGAGPGDPDLLTLKAARLLGMADVIVHDGLVSPEILALAPATATRISVEKRRSRHSMPQPDINALLVRLAREGRQVIRLKGGDPFIFGRGGEELEAARAAGIGCTVVPGISAALGCAAAANLPLTHRALSSAVTFVTGTCQGLKDQDWRGLAGTGRTLVIYMGVTTADLIADKLMADGVSPDMPVTIIERGTCPGHRAIRTLLAGLGDVVTRESVSSPAVLIVGRVAGLADAEDVIATSAFKALESEAQKPW